jgi:mono/diheme cytochrome c family protein
MRKVFVSLCAVLALVGSIWKVSAAGDDGDKEAIDRGRYLVEFAGCYECHTPRRIGPSGPEPVKERLFSGHPQDAVLPPMPHYGSATDGDLKAMFAYFMTVPPIRNQVPDPVPPGSAGNPMPD